jgi:hypothetical protein
LPTPFVDGISWATPEFVAANYGALLIVYIVGFFFREKKPDLLMLQSLRD